MSIFSLLQSSKPKQRTNSSPSSDDTNASPVPHSRTPPVQAKGKAKQTIQSSQPEPVRPTPAYRRNLRDLVKHKREQYAEGKHDVSFSRHNFTAF